MSERTHSKPSLIVGLFVATLTIAVISVASLIQNYPAAAQISPPGDLKVVFTDDPDPLVGGDILTYTAVITNIGGFSVGTETDIGGNPIPMTTRVFLPKEFVLSSFSVTAGGTCVAVAGRIECTFIGPIGPGASETITVTGTVTPAIDIQVSALAIVDEPFGVWAEAVEVTNNVAKITTDVVVTAPPVGGLVVDLDGDLGDRPLDTARSSASNTGLLAGIVATISVGTVTLGGAAWYARRRRLR